MNTNIAPTMDDIEAYMDQYPWKTGDGRSLKTKAVNSLRVLTDFTGLCPVEALERLAVSDVRTSDFRLARHIVDQTSHWLKVKEDFRNEAPDPFSMHDLKTRLYVCALTNMANPSRRPEFPIRGKAECDKLVVLGEIDPKDYDILSAINWERAWGVAGDGKSSRKIS